MPCSDGIIVFRGVPLCGAARQEPQDNKWDVCKFTGKGEIFQTAAAEAFVFITALN